MKTDLSALKAAVKLLADAAMDTEKVILTGGSPLAALIAYRNLVPDIMALAPQIGDVPVEASAMKPDDYVTLIGELAKDLSLTDAHAGMVLDKALTLLQTVTGSVAPQVMALVDAVKNK